MIFTLDELLARTEPDGDCLIWQGTKTRPKDGYGVVERKGKRYLIHRVVFSLTHDNMALTRGNAICHTCDRPPCINPDHLWLGTLAMNNSDRAVKGRNKPGRAKVTEAQVIQMRRIWKAKVRPMSWFVETYGLSEGSIYNIMSRQSWRHLSPET